MNTMLTDAELLQQLEARPGVIAKYLRERESGWLRDLTAANEKLLKSEQIKSDFLSNIRNEIINPLSALLELSAALAETADDRSRRLAGLIHEESIKLGFQMRNILAAAEVESGLASVNVTRVHVAELIDRAIHGNEKALNKKGLSIQVYNEMEVSAFPADAEKVDLIFQNLLSNAIQFSTLKGEIDVVIRCTEEELRIAVKDFGIGISEQDQAEVFSRFVQLDMGSTKNYPGHGLGLSITSALLELMQGRMELISAPHMGSTFTVIIPAAYTDEDLDHADSGNEFLFNLSDEIF